MNNCSYCHYYLIMKIEGVNTFSQFCMATINFDFHCILEEQAN